jgi:hypothetical protein
MPAARQYLSWNEKVKRNDKGAAEAIDHVLSGQGDVMKT